MSRVTVALTFFLFGCTEIATEVSVVEAVLPPPDTQSTSQQMADVFIATCLQSFPNLEKAERALQSAGFNSARSVERPYDGIYSHPLLGFDAYVGNIASVIPFDGAPGASGSDRYFSTPTCNITGHVEDPQNFERDVITTLKIALPDSTILVNSKNSTNDWFAKFILGEEEISVNAFVQTVQSSNNQARCNINENFPCQWWSLSGISISSSTQRQGSNDT